MQPNANDQHVVGAFPLNPADRIQLVIRVKNDFGLVLSNELPSLGSASRGLRVISESWNSARNQLTLEVSGRSGSRYELAVWNPSQISSAEGATLTKASLQFQIPGALADSYSRQRVVIHFAKP